MYTFKSIVDGTCVQPVVVTVAKSPFVTKLLEIQEVQQLAEGVVKVLSVKHSSLPFQTLIVYVVLGFKFLKVKDVAPATLSILLPAPNIGVVPNVEPSFILASYTSVLLKFVIVTEPLLFAVPFVQLPPEIDKSVLLITGEVQTQ